MIAFVRIRFPNKAMTGINSTRHSQKVDPNWIIENCSSIALRSVTGKLQMELRD